MGEKWIGDKMLPKSTVRSDLKIVAKLVLLSLHSSILLLLSVQCDCHSINATNISGNFRYGSMNSSMKAGLYANHRMDVDIDTVPPKNFTLRHVDREASGSVLRPQLALQIYTHPNTNSQDGHKSTQTHLSATIRPASTMMIIPMHKSDNHPTSASNQRQHPRSPNSGDGSRSKSSAGYRTSNKLNNWHYITDQTASSNSIESYAGTSGGTVEGLAAANHAANERGGPLINAIITVPSPSEHHHHHHHPQQQHQFNYSPLNNPLEDALANTTLHSSIEQTITRLIDDPANSNIEFSLNLNGDELTISPVQGRSNMLDSNGTKSMQTETLDQDESLLPRRFVGRGKEGSKPMRKVTENDLVGDQQSASEIDLVDGSTEDEEHELDSNRHLSNRAMNQKKKSRESDSNQFDENHGDDHATGESNQRSAKSYNNGRTYFTQEDKKNGLLSKQSSGKPVKSIERKLQVGSNNNMLKKSSLNGRKKQSEKGDDRDFDESEEQAGPGKRETKGDKDTEVSSITIKGEDVKKFEQLLENLKSLSINRSASNNKVKKQNKPMKATQSAQKPSIDPDDDDSYGKNEDSTSTVHNAKSNTWDDAEPTSPSVQQDKKGSSQNRQTLSETEARVDCEHRRPKQVQKPGNGDESNGSFEAEPSTNVSEQDPITSNDNIDDLNDDASTQSTSEQDEQGSSNHNVKIPNAELELEQQSSRDSEQDRGRPAEGTLDQKSVLRTYYKNNGNPLSEPNNDDLKTIHQTQHDALHDQHSGLDIDMAKHQQPSDPGSQHQTVIMKTRQVPVHSYIDYSSLDDREIYRGSESAHVKTILPLRKYSSRSRPFRLVARNERRPPSRLFPNHVEESETDMR